jgi:4-hydroxy-tetrahydrodipicolinate reductase
MNTPLKFAIAGAAGRMGRQLITAALNSGHRVTGGSEQAASKDIQTDLGTLAGQQELGATPVERVTLAARDANIWIDFTRPAATLEALESLTDTPVQTVIIGTTGFSDIELAKIGTYSDRFAIVRAGNFSLGIALATKLTELAAAHLGEDWDIEIHETHHRHKVDAPSGTALMLGQAVASGRDADLETLRASPYDGPNAQRQPGQVGFSVKRAGGVIGDHDVSFTSEFERISISHNALDRRVFADGAIKAAEWASRQPPGLYTIRQVLGL